MRYFFYLLPLILFPYFDLSAQTNPDNNNSLSDSDSIVIIQKDPVIVRKVLLIEEDVKTSNFYFEAFTSTFINKNYYNVCEECKAYLSNIKAATKPSVGYSSGANLIYLKNHLLTSFGASYTQVREVFNYHGEGKSINNFDYIDFNLSGGYRINKKRLSIAIIGGVIMSQTLSLKGETISEADTVSRIDLKAQNQFRNTTYSLAFNLKFFYQISHKLSLVVEPFYHGNITPVTKKYEPYVLQRNFIGSKFGLLYSF